MTVHWAVILILFGGLLLLVKADTFSSFDTEIWMNNTAAIIILIISIFLFVRAYVISNWSPLPLGIFSLCAAFFMFYYVNQWRRQGKSRTR